jgi:hypothetical protein
MRTERVRDISTIDGALEVEQRNMSTLWYMLIALTSRIRNMLQLPQKFIMRIQSTGD